MSLVALWEIVIRESKARPILGTSDAHAWFVQAMDLAGFHVLEIRARHVGAVQSLPLHHRDPFDRLLVAQATVEEVPIVTADSKIDLYDIEVIQAS